MRNILSLSLAFFVSTSLVFAPFVGAQTSTGGTAATTSVQAPQTPSPQAAKPSAKYEDLTKSTPTSSAPPKTINKVESDGEGLYLNAVDTDIREIIKQISKAAGKNFLIDDKVKGKVTILSEKKMTIDEAYQAFISALEVLGFTVVSGPSGLLKIIPLKDALTTPLPIYKDDSPITDSFITRLITMKNVSALDIASAVKPLISKEGNLFAYPSTNTLIVTDTGTNIDRLLKIIREMDTQGPEQLVEIYTVKNASAKDVADKIQKLYVDQQATKRTGGGKGVELDDVPFISKVIPDERTNSVILLASKRALAKIRDLMSLLDKPLDGSQGKVHVHYLKNAEAKKMADVLTALTSGAGKTAAAAAAGAPGKGGAAVPTVAEFEGGVKVAADESTNSLLITATQKDYETLVEEVINKLDIPRRQVYVEVIIMELNIKKDRTIGFNAQGGDLFGLGPSGTVGFGSLLGGMTSGLPAALSSAGAAGVISKDTVTFNRPNPDGTTTPVSMPAFGALMTAMQNDTNVNILSTPNLLTLDNEEASIIVGGEEPFPTGTTVTSGGNTSFNVTRQNVGITLKITPQVNEGEMVKMKVKQEVTAVVPGASDAVRTSIGPSTTKRSVETVVVSKDEQTIVIGGLIDDKLNVGESKVPFLGDIPILGNLFKSKTKTKSKTNILIFLRPFIIRDTADFLKILQKKVEERNMFVEQNYGASQQKMIRESIRSHASELLEFKKDIQLLHYDYQSKYGNQSSLDQKNAVGEPAAVEPAAATETPKPKVKKNKKVKAKSID
ncbi:MAG: type II secretion system secretin GspD [Deltaproteobacteria bacterium]|nr:type II secretion system secretin GspD [Deltaproteobacteria bacterium]